MCQKVIRKVKNRLLFEDKSITIKIGKNFVFGHLTGQNILYKKWRTAYE